jgi:hypothetical protein
MTKFGWFLLGICLLGIGLLAGGCSLVFTQFVFDGSGIIVIWLAGLLIGAAAIWASVMAFRKM